VASPPPQQPPADDADQVLGSRGPVVTPAVDPNFGTRKVRIGVKIKDGSTVPSGTNTENSVVTIHETGPNAGGPGGFSINCTTVPGTEEPGSTESFCQFEVQISGQTFTVDGYNVAEGDAITVTQQTAGPNLRRDRRARTLGPCVNGADPNFPTCPEPNGDSITDTVTFADTPPRALYDAMSSLNPIDYWVLDDRGAPAGNEVGFQPLLTPVGARPAARWHVPVNPPTGQPGSVRLTAGGRRSGEYLRSGRAPGTDASGTIVMWFRAPKSLPGWRQVLAVDNGAFSGTGGGLMIDTAGHLISADTAGFVDFRSKRKVNDGRWHCVAWADTFHPSADPNERTGSTLYLDGKQLTHSLTAVLPKLLGVHGSRLLLGDAGPTEPRSTGRFTGNLSNVAIYDDLLNGDEVFDIWAVGMDLSSA
jgi:hypothetical protein